MMLASDAAMHYRAALTVIMIRLLMVAVAATADAERQGLRHGSNHHRKACKLGCESIPVGRYESQELH